MKLFTGILKLFGKKSDESKIPKEIDDLINQHMNRTIHKTLTENIIDETSDDDLLQIVFDNLSAKQSDYSNEFEIVMSWNKSRQAIYIIWLLETEVNNGGFNQFYSNSSGEFSVFLPEVLKLVGAEKFAVLAKNANDVFENENQKITQSQDGTIEGFSKSYEDNPLNELDDVFYELYNEENLHQIQIDYIRKHKLDFVNQ